MASAVIFTMAELGLGAQPGYATSWQRKRRQAGNRGGVNHKTALRFRERQQQRRLGGMRRGKSDTRSSVYVPALSLWSLEPHLLHLCAAQTANAGDG